MVLSKTCFVTLLHTIHKLTFRTKHIEIEITIKEIQKKVKERKQIINWLIKNPGLKLAPAILFLIVEESPHFPFFFLDTSVCSEEIKSIIPQKVSFPWNTRFSNIQHPFAINLNTNRKNVFASLFISMTYKDWNYLPASTVPVAYIILALSSPAFIGIFSFDQISEIYFYSPYTQCKNKEKS